MNIEEEQLITCPYCGEQISILIDRSYDTPEYIEDCQVCCRPITFQVNNTDSEIIQVQVKHENE
jgi:hypothetical protein